MNIHITTIIICTLLISFVILMTIALQAIYVVHKIRKRELSIGGYDKSVYFSELSEFSESSEFTRDEIQLIQQILDKHNSKK